MRIRMYNVGFGDCFCLRNKKNNLLVDFGTSNNRIGKRPRRDIFDMIISDLSTIRNKNLLLTQFHLDHLSGLFYLMKYRKGSYEFGKIYLPDVFSEERMSRTLALLLLSDLMKDSCLPSHQVSLYALAEILYRKPQNIELLSRGKLFEKKYVALWPDTGIVQAETEKMLDILMPQHREILEKIISFAEKLRRMIFSMTESKADGEKRRFEDTITDLEQEFRSLRSTTAFYELLEFAQEQKLSFRHLKNTISVAFQNAEDDDDNLLFTGDVEPENMKRIAENYDGKVSLFKNYWCIKVPHHGTDSHYYDFSSYEPENLLISSGIYHATSKRKAKENRISPQYAGLFHTWDVTMWCTNRECCDGYHDGCSCRECEIVAPRYYIDIR